MTWALRSSVTGELLSPTTYNDLADAEQAAADHDPDTTYVSNEDA